MTSGIPLSSLSFLQHADKWLTAALSSWPRCSTSHSSPFPVPSALLTSPIIAPRLPSASHFPSSSPRLPSAGHVCYCLPHNTAPLSLRLPPSFSLLSPPLPFLLPPLSPPPSFLLSTLLPPPSFYLIISFLVFIPLVFSLHG